MNEDDVKGGIKDESFESELTALLNRHSIDNDSNTSDFILAGYIKDCLFVYKKVTRERDRRNHQAKSKPKKISFREFLQC